MAVKKGVLTAGVIGTGNLGRNHARIYTGIEDVGRVLLFDVDSAKAGSVALEHKAVVSDSVDDLISACDILSVCTPATNHHELVLKALNSGVHVLVEKPIASNSIEGRELADAAEENGCVLQVGHIERFNGAFEAVCGLVDNPMFIEAHRLGTFTPRGIDVSVVVDLMIHDIDIILRLLGPERLIDCRSSGAGVLTRSPDIVNARLQFENGCVANITASRISREPLRKIRIFQENLYVSADLRNRKVEAFRKARGTDIDHASEDPLAFIEPLSLEIDNGEPLKKEISAFVNSVTDGSDVVVTGDDGVRAIVIAEKILEGLRGV